MRTEQPDRTERPEHCLVTTDKLISFSKTGRDMLCNSCRRPRGTIDLNLYINSVMKSDQISHYEMHFIDSLTITFARTKWRTTTRCLGLESLEAGWRKQHCILAI